MGLGICLLLLNLCIPNPVLAWGIAGHEVIGEIAYQLLKPTARRKVTTLSRILSREYIPYNFRTLGTWPDALKRSGVSAFNSWHYINLPYVVDGQRRPHLKTPNAVWAILQAQKVLKNPKTKPYTKAMFLAFFIHFAGDLHQPMHCINRISQKFPGGDRGGNLFPIQFRRTTNLHRLWENGLGVFSQLYQRKRLQPKRISQFAKHLMKQFPPQHFGDKIKQTDPWAWARESHAVAREIAYNIKPGSTPSREYLEAGRTIVYQQLTLAAYRLAYLLNQLLTQPVKFNQRLSGREHHHASYTHYRRR